jgi:hypothetical protein
MHGNGTYIFSQRYVTTNIAKFPATDKKIGADLELVLFTSLHYTVTVLSVKGSDTHETSAETDLHYLKK